MNHEDRNLKSKGYTNFKGSLHMGIGGLYLTLGSVMLYSKHFGPIAVSTLMAYSVGSLLVLYGGFRIWRGWTYIKHKGN